MTNIRTNVPDELEPYQRLYDAGIIGELSGWRFKLSPPFSDIESDVIFFELESRLEDGRQVSLTFFVSPDAARQLSDALKRAYLEIPGGDLGSLPQ